MLVDSLMLDNIRCFRHQTLDFERGVRPRPGEPHRWVTLLGENGVGKSTILQLLALLLAGPEAAKELLPRPDGWVRDPAKAGRLTASLLGGSDDGQAFDESGRSSSPNGRRDFTVSYSMTSTFPIKVGRETYAEPALVEDHSRALSWLRTNAFASNARGWFAAGYGSFRRLPKVDGILVPSLTLDPSTRASGFVTLFDEDRALNTFDRWMVSLDYRIAKDPHDDEARRMRDVGERTIARLLPKNTRILDVAADGMTRFRIDGRIVPSTGLSDGYRSVVALAGDLIWRLMQAYPDLDDPTHAPGVVLIDELDAHLHPSWQRQIAGWLRDTFPQLQFIVATHSPLIAIGAGEDARTLLLEASEGETRVTLIKDLSAYDADRALRSPAFGLPSTYSPTTDDKIKRYYELRGRLVAGDVSLDAREKKEYEKLEQFMAEAQPIGGQPGPGSLEARIDAYLESVLR